MASSTTLGYRWEKGILGFKHMKNLKTTVFLIKNEKMLFNRKNARYFNLY
jgi:hypothetical protein